MLKSDMEAFTFSRYCARLQKVLSEGCCRSRCQVDNFEGMHPFHSRFTEGYIHHRIQVKFKKGGHPQSFDRIMALLYLLFGLIVVFDQ